MLNDPPYWIRSKVVDLMARKKRAVEETHYCSSEMRQAHAYFKASHTQIKKLLDSANDTESDLIPMSAGQRALLLKKLLCIERRCISSQRVFSSYVSIDAIDTYFMEEDVSEHRTQSDIIEDELSTDIESDLLDVDSSDEDCCE